MTDKQVIGIMAAILVAAGKCVSGPGGTEHAAALATEILGRVKVAG